MDIQMPVLDGYKATFQIMKLLKLNNIKTCSILALTSYTGEQVEEKCYSLGMKGVIHKPLKHDKLKEVLDKYYFE